MVFIYLFVMLFLLFISKQTAIKEKVFYNPCMLGLGIRIKPLLLTIFTGSIFELYALGSVLCWL